MNATYNVNVSIEELERQIEEVFHNRCGYISALSTADVLLGNDTEWAEMRKEDGPLNAMELCKMIGTLNIECDSDIVTLEELRDYLEARINDLRNTQTMLEAHKEYRLSEGRNKYRVWLRNAVDEADCLNKKQALNGALDEFDELFG